MKPDCEEIAKFEQCLLPCHLRQEGSGKNDPPPPPVFIGRYSQRGFGFGSILSGLARKIILPAVKSLGKAAVHSLKKRALKSGTDLAKDIFLEKKGIKKSLKDHGKKLAREVAGDILSHQKGRGRRKRKLKDNEEEEEEDIFSKKPRKVSDVFIA